MRKLALFLVMALLAVFSLTPLSAQAPQPDVFALAALTPADAEVYMSIRIDDAYLTTLNGLVALVTNAAQEIGLPVESIPRLQDLIGTQIESNVTPEQVDQVLALMGDTLAISTTRDSNDVETFTVYLPIADKDGVLDIISMAGGVIQGVGTAGPFIIYEAKDNQETHFLLSDDMLIVTTADANLIGSGDYPKLSDASAFANAVADLPADGYNLVAYLSKDVINQNSGSQDVFTGDILIAGTILNDKTLTLDAVAVPTTPAQPSQAIDPAFLRHVPANSTAVVHATNLSALLNSIITIAEGGDNPNARAEIEQGLASIDLSLDDLLAWTQGDYALFARADMPVLLQAILNQNPEALAGALDFGMVIQATDATLAKKFSDKIASLLGSIIGSQPGVALSVQTVNGTDLTRIEINVPTGNNGQTLNLALGFGANDDVFVFGTFAAVESIVNNSGGLATNPLYAESTAYVLPGATSVWYSDGATLTSAGALSAVGLMRASVGGSVFDGIEQEFNFGRQTAARAQTIQSEDEVVMIMRGLDRLSKLIRFATASTTISASGSYVLRATLTLGE